MSARVLAGISPAAIVLTLLGFAPCIAEEKVGVDVQLTVTGGTVSLAPRLYVDNYPYDPSQPDQRTLILKVVNHTDRAITLPVRNGQGASLYGYAAEVQAHSVLGQTLWLRSLDEKPADTIRIEPGKEARVFWAQLDELLGGRRKDANDKAARKWAWDWQLHPQPPGSPIYLPGREEKTKLASAAVLWAEITIDKQVLRSPPVLLRIKQPDSAAQDSKAVVPDP
jgi:hypothetical protein